ncbi:MAG TPA: PAS domain S-box protein [Dehalococcoidales bacterium]
MVRTAIAKRESTAELKFLRQRVTELEELVARHQQVDKKSHQLEDEQKYKAVFESATDIIVLMDKKGKITDVNNKFKEILGYEREELLGKNLTSLDIKSPNDIVNRKGRDVLVSNFQKRVVGSPVSPYEIEAVKKDGELITLEVNACALNKDDRIIGDLAVLRDVTERKRAEQALKENEERLHIMLEASSEGFDLHDGKKIIDMNESGARMLGCTRNEIIGENINDFIAEESLDFISKNIGAHYDQPYEAMFKRKDGSKFPVKIKAKSVTYQGRDVRLVSFHDLTAQKRYEELLENIVVNAPVSMSIIQDGRFKFVNRQLCQDMGHTEAEVLAMDVMQYVYPEDRELVRQNTLQMFSGRRTEPFEFRTVNKNDDMRWVLQSVTPINYNGRRANLGMYLDITERKLAEIEYKTIIQTTIDGFWLADMQGRFLDVNDAYCRLVGYSRDELLKMSIPDIEAVERPEETAARIARIMKNGSDRFETYHRCKDGRIINVEISVNYIKVGAGSMIVFIRDITEHKREEERLTESEENFRNSIDNSPVGIMVFKLEGEIIYANRALLGIYGFENTEELRNTPTKDRYTPESYAEYLVRHEKFMNGHTESLDYEVDIVRKDGTVRHLHAFRREVIWGREKQYQLLYFDATEQKLAEAALKISEERFRRLAENARDIIFRFRSPPKVGFDYISPAVLRITGYAPDEFYADPLLIFKIAHPDSRSFLGEITSHPQDYLDKPAILQWVHRDGEIFWTEQRTVPIYDKDGKVIAIEGIIRDITDRKKSEEALKASEENFRNSLDSSSLGIRIVNENGDTLYANRAMLAIYGYESIDELNATGVSERYTPESYAEHVLRQEKRRRGEPVPNEYEISIVHKDGTIRHLQVFRKEVLWDGKKQYQVLYNDMTEQKRMQEALKNSEEQFRRLAENARDFIYRYRIGDNPGYEYVSRAATRISGFTPEEYYADPQLLTNLIYPEDREKLRSIMNNLQEYRDKSFVVRYLRKDGKINWIEQRATYVLDDSGKVVAMQGIARDVTEREEAVRALKESGENYRNSIDNSPMGVVVFDKDEKIIYANRAILDIYGFDNIEELRSTPVKERYTPESYAEYLRRSEKFRSGETTSLGYELSIRRKDGGIRHLQAFRKEIVWDGKKQFQLLYIDITERKRAEDAMRESRARFRDLARMLPLSIWETDENGMINYTNEATMKLYGYTRQDTEPIHHLKNMVPQDRDRAARNTQRLLQGETLGGIEYTGLKKDGSTFPTMVYGSAIIRNGKGVGLRGITVDITEQKIAEKRLEMAAQEWRTTFDSLTDMVCILDNNFRITRVNMAYANMFKKEPQELLGKACYELLNRDCPHQDCPLQKTLQTKKPARAEFLEPALGSFVEVATSPIFDGNGDIKGAVHVMRDISERKQMEQQLMLTDRLASVGELASGIAHELNNPLTSVIGFSQLLIEGGVPDNIKEDLNLINSEAQRAANIVKNLLTFARKHAAVKQSTRINNVIEDVLKLRAYEQKVNNIQVIKKLASDLPEIMIDYFQIQQVFLNLVINAEFFMTESHHRGTLTITTERVDKNVRISFADDGPGIPQENLKRIFDPFFTTKEVGKGTGLGLSICHGIIAEHGGNISAESEVGKGAAFIVELPI